MAFLSRMAGKGLKCSLLQIIGDVIGFYNAYLRVMRSNTGELSVLSALRFNPLYTNGFFLLV